MFEDDSVVDCLADPSKSLNLSGNVLSVRVVKIDAERMKMVQKRIDMYKKKAFLSPPQASTTTVTSSSSEAVELPVPRRGRQHNKKTSTKTNRNYKNYQKKGWNSSLLIYNEKQVLGGIFHFKTKRRTDVLLKGQHYDSLNFVYRTKVQLRKGNVPVR